MTNMADNFDLKKFITEAKLKIKVPVKEMARIAKEKYKLNPDFPQIKDRIKNPSGFKLDRPCRLLGDLFLLEKIRLVMTLSIWVSSIRRPLRKWLMRASLLLTRS